MKLIIEIIDNGERSNINALGFCLKQEPYNEVDKSSCICVDGHVAYAYYTLVKYL